MSRVLRNMIWINLLIMFIIIVFADQIADVLEWFDDKVIAWKYRKGEVI